MGRNNGCSMGEICCLINLCFIYVSLLYHNRRESDEHSSSHRNINTIESNLEGSSSSSIEYDKYYIYSDYVMYGITAIYLILMFAFVIFLCSIMKNKTHKHAELSTSEFDESKLDDIEVNAMIV